MDGAHNDWRDLMWSSAGRIARVPFWVCSVLLLVVTTLYVNVQSSAFHWITGWVVYPVLTHCAASVLSKRLHDRGRSGWWSALILLSVLVVWPDRMGFFVYPFWLVLAWAVVELGFMPGEQGANGHGPSPLSPAVPI